MSATQLAPFNPEDAFDAMAEEFRRKCATLFLDAMKAALFRDLPPHRQMECFMAGLVTGLVGVCFAQIKPEGRDEVMAVITAYLPQARMNVEEMCK